MCFLRKVFLLVLCVELVDVQKNYFTKNFLKNFLKKKQSNKILIMKVIIII
jgi:hypothetical protein